MATAAVIAGVGIYAYKKIHKRHDEHERQRSALEQQTNNIAVQQHDAAGAYPARPLSVKEIHHFLSNATLKQLLAMLVDGVYSRDRGRKDLPGWTFKEVVEDELTEFYTKGYWTRMYEITTEEEREVGLKHYLRREPDDLANGCHNQFRLVIALRGTKLSSIRDIGDDIKVALYTLHCSSRYKKTQRLIEKIIDLFRKHYNGSISEVCITGHSLGAAIALSIGRDLAMDPSKRYAVHCFNPPFLSLLMVLQKLTCYERLKTNLKSCELLEPFLQVGSITKQVGKLVLAKYLLHDHSKVEEEFRHFYSLIDWKPVLYVNKGDLICREYLRFYEWKERCALQFGLPIHMQALVSKIVKQNAKYSTLVPSVDMYIGQSIRRGLMVCHPLKQWFRDSTLKIDHREFQLLPHDAEFSWKSILTNMIRKILDEHSTSRSLPAQSSHNQSKITDYCFDDDADDEEISPGSAEALVLESD